MVKRRRKYEREGKKGTINVVLKSGWNQIVEKWRCKFIKKGESRKAEMLKVLLSLSSQS